MPKVKTPIVIRTVKGFSSGGGYVSLPNDLIGQEVAIVAINSLPIVNAVVGAIAKQKRNKSKLTN